MTNILKSLNLKPIAFYPIYAKIGGSINAGILLSQLMYWFAQSKSNTIYKIDKELQDETTLSRDELKRAKSRIRKLSFLSVTKKGLPAKTYYEIDWALLEAEIKKFSDNETAETKKSGSDNGGGSYKKEQNFNNFEAEKVKSQESQKVENIILIDNINQKEAKNELNNDENPPRKKHLFSGVKSYPKRDKNPYDIWGETGFIEVINHPEQEQETSQSNGEKLAICETDNQPYAYYNAENTTENTQRIHRDYDREHFACVHTHTRGGESKNDEIIFEVLPPKNTKTKNDNAYQDLPAFIDPDLWSEYLAYKKARREKLTPIGLKNKFAEWAKWHFEGINVNECIRLSMANDWQGVFKPRANNYQTQHERNMAYTRAQMLEFLADNGVSL